MKEELYVCTVSSVQTLLDQAHQHNRQCQDNVLAVTVNNHIGHVMQAGVSCNSGHRFMWTSSPKIKGGKFLGNLRMAHGYLTSGMLPNHMEKLCAEAKIGHLGDKFMKGLTGGMRYNGVINDLSARSMEHALQEEVVATQEVQGHRAEDGISITTDSCYSVRKYAQFTNVVCLGACTHSCLRVETIQG